MSWVTDLKVGDRQDVGSLVRPPLGPPPAVSPLPPCSTLLCSCPSISAGPWGKPGLRSQVWHFLSRVSLRREKDNTTEPAPPQPPTVFLHREGVPNLMLPMTVLRGVPVPFQS